MKGTYELYFSPRRLKILATALDYCFDQVGPIATDEFNALLDSQKQLKDKIEEAQIMTTNEAVDFIQELMDLNIASVQTLVDTDSIVSEHVAKVRLAMTIIKADLAGGYMHYEVKR